MGIGLSDAVEPLGTFAIAKDIHLQGGYRSVTDAAERDAITDARRSEGMLVYTRDNNTMWRLGPGLTNADWVEHITRGLITVQDNTGTPIGVRSTLMVEGASVVDEPGNNRVRITVPAAPPAAIEVREEGNTAGTRGIINFKGAGITAVDNPGQSAVDVTVSVVNSTDNGLAFRTWQKGKMSPAPGAEVTSQSFAAAGGGPSVVHFNNIFIYHALEGLNELAIRYFDPLTGTGGILNPGPSTGSAYTDLCAVTDETAGNLLAIVEPSPGAVQIYSVSFAISPTNGTVTPTFSFVTAINGVNGGRAVVMGHYLLVTHPNADNLAYIDLRNGYATGTAAIFASATAPIAVAVDMSGAQPRVWVSTNTNVFSFRFTGTFPLTPDTNPGLTGGQLHMEFDGRYLWANDGSVITAVDPTTQTSVLSLQTPVLQPSAYSKLTFDGKSIWTSGNCGGTPSIVRLAVPDGIVAKYSINATSVRAAGVNDVGDIAVCAFSGGPPQMGLTVLRNVGDSTQRDARFDRLALPHLANGPIGMIGGVVANINSGIALNNIGGIGVTDTHGIISLSGEDYEMVPNAAVDANGLSIHSNAGVGNASARALGTTRDIFVESVTAGIGPLIGSGGVPTGTGRVRRLVEGRGIIFATDDANEIFLRGFDPTTFLVQHTIDGNTFAWTITDLGSFFYVGPDQSGNDMFVGTSTNSNVLSRFTPTTVLDVSNPTTGATFGTVQGCPIRTYTSTPDIYADDQILGVFLGDDGQIWLTDDLTTGLPVTATGTGLNVAQATFMHSVWGYNFVPALRRTENGYIPGQSPYGMRSVVYFTQPTSGVLTATHSLMCYDLQANTLTLVGGVAGLIPPGVRNLAFDGHYLWGYGHNGQPRLHKINPYTGKVVRSVAVPIGNTTHARTHWDGKFIWVTGDAHTGFGNTDNLAKVDPDKGEVIARVTIGSTTYGLIGSGASDDVFVTTDTSLHRVYNRQPLAGDGLTVRGAEVHAGVQAVTTSTYTVDANDHHLVVSAPVGGTVITLPASVPVGYTLYVSDASGNAGSRNISLARQGSHTIIGLTTYVLAINYASIKLRFVGSNLWVVL